jgi:hypothetical protein
VRSTLLVPILSAAFDGDAAEVESLLNEPSR